MDTVYCRHCGAANEPGDYCTACDEPLSGGTNDVVAHVIPYKNVPGLLAYYFGVFSLIPCLALVLGPTAVVLGLVGLNTAKKNPQAHGRVHCWIGIVLGGLTTLANAVVIGLAASGAFRRGF